MKLELPLDAPSARLDGVHPDLIRCVQIATVPMVAYQAIDGVRIISGKRTEAEQRKLVRSGVSPTMNSLHILGRAIDVTFLRDGQALWDYPLYRHFHGYMEDGAQMLMVPLEWGGHWKSVDAVHWQIPF